jgi:hypothetical protein
MDERPEALALVAHEVGGALAPARNALDVVRTGRAGELTAEARRFLDIAARNIGRAGRILDNMVAIAMPAAYAPRRETAPVLSLLARCCEEFAGEATLRGIALGWECDAAIEACTDAGCLEQILANLVSNALKFTPAGGRITLRAEAARGPVLPERLSLLGGGFAVKPRLVTLEVRDTGIGLTPEARERLFEPYYSSAEARMCGGAGLGLGLTVARSLARLLHGDLRLGACAGQEGTRFVVTLPADEATLDLVAGLDSLIADLNEHAGAASYALVVLRVPAAIDAALQARAAAALSQALPEAQPAIAILTPTTWVVAGACGVRALLAPLVQVLRREADPVATAAVRMYARQVRRGTPGDEALLCGLVRCRHPLPARLASMEGVAGGEDSARR